MESVPKRALRAAQERGLDLSVVAETIPTSPFRFKCLKPKYGMIEAFQNAQVNGEEWPSGMPLVVVLYHAGRNEWEIMDGMMRICAAIIAGYDAIPALVAKGETYDALEDILRDGYYGEDFVEMLSMVNEEVARNLQHRDGQRLAGL